MLSRTPSVYTLEIKGQPVNVSIERLKPAILSPAKADALSRANHEPPKMSNECSSGTSTNTVRQPTVKTRSGRKVSFKDNADYVYY